MSIGEILYYWRTKKQVSIYKLAKQSGISESHIRNLENGTKQPTVNTLETLTNSLGIPLLEFFNTENKGSFYLNADEERLLNLYRSLPPDKASLLIDFYERMCKE